MSAPNPADFLPTHATLVPGAHARTIDVRAIVDPARIPKLAPGSWMATVPRPTLDELLKTFYDAVRAGCFPPGVPSKKVVSKRHVEPDGEVIAEAWEISLPEMPVAAFDVLFRMAAECASRYNGLLSLAVEERAAPEVRRVGRDELPPLEYPAAAFPVENTAYPDGEDVTILVTFAEDLSKATLKRTKQLIECWGKLVTLGGFRPRGDVPSSCGFLSDSSSHLDNEVVCTIQQLNASAQIWGPLIHGLGVIHQDAAIEGVEIY